MKTYINHKWLITVLFLFFYHSWSSASETRLLRNPDVHGNHVVFSYGGDLYTSTASGKNVKQLTSFAGEESWPAFSPDGKQIAFTAEFEGNTDVYVIPTEGGEAERLTFHPNTDLVVGWHPDGDKVLFRSMRSSSSHRFFRLHLVSVHGGLPTLVELPEAELSAYNKSGDQIAFCRTSLRDWRFKRYRGGGVPNIWTYDFNSQKAELIIDDQSINHYPMWIGDSIYFLSDRGAEQKMNLWVYDKKNKKIQQLTFHNDWEIKSAANDSKQIIYECGGSLYTYGIENGKIRQLKFRIDLPEGHLAEVEKDVKANFHSPTLSPDGQRIIAVARGDLFLIEPATNQKLNLTKTSGVNERAPKWSPDGKYYAYLSDHTGEEQIYLKLIDDNSPPIQISHHDRSRFANLCWSPDSKKIGYSDQRSVYYVVDIASKESQTIFFDQFNGNTNYVSASWAPDSKWLVFSKHLGNWFGTIYLYSLENQSTHQVTDNFQNDYEPIFDPDGNYLYWISDRKVNVEHTNFDDYPYRVNPSKIIIATLRKDTFLPIFGSEDNVELARGGNSVSLQIDTDGLGDRIVSLPIEDSYYSDLKALSGSIIYQHAPPNGENSMKIFDLKEKKESILVKEAAYCIPASHVRKMVYSAKGKIGIMDIKPDQSEGEGQLDLSGLMMTIDYKKEWREVFNEVWRIQRDFLWDQNMHGVDWVAIKIKYETLLPYVASRNDLNFLIEEMCSELGQSHVEVYGGDMPAKVQEHNGTLGVDLKWDSQNQLYQISKIYRGQNWDENRISPLTLPGMNVNEGDYLISIDGTVLTEATNPYSLLVNKAHQAVTLTISTKTDLRKSRTLSVQAVTTSLDQGDFLRYNDWVWQNIEKVDKATNGRVGYIHLADTWYPGIESILRYYYAQTSKEALIVDIRFNAGGFSPYSLIERMNRTLLFNKQYPYGKAPGTEPEPAFFGKKVCITNEWAESGGDMFASLFRQLNLGPLIGQRTAGSLSSTGGFRLIDGGVVIYPSMGPHDSKGNYIIENKGIEPDIEVINRPDEMIKGIDLQLERSIDEIMKSLK